MTVIEMQVMSVVKDNMPKIAKELKRIADALEQKKVNNDGNDAA